MKTPAIAFVLVLGATGGLAQTHLVPEGSEYSNRGYFQSDYDKVVLNVFEPVFEDDVRARVIVEPSFSNEFAVGIRGAPEAYRIFYYDAPDHLWDYELVELMKKGDITSSNNGKSTTADEIARLQSGLPTDPTSIKLDRCEISVSTSLGQQIVDLWKRVLLQTHYDEDVELGVDGDTYHFSMHDKYQDLAGQVWSPPEDTDAGSLTGIVYAMKDFCSKKDTKSFAKLNARVDELSGRAHLLSSKNGSSK